MKKVLIFGADNSNYNYKKIEGFIYGFRTLGYDVFHYSRDISNEELLTHGNIDIIFTESSRIYVNYTNVKNVIFWTNYDIDNIIKLAISNPSLNIILGPKSFIFDQNINEEYMKKFNTPYYQKVSFEGQNLSYINNILRKSVKITDSVYKILNNLTLMYMPCSLSIQQKPQEIKKNRYKFAYFGTGSNRPGVTEVIKYLLNHPVYNKQTIVNFVENGIINPEKCLEYYRETEYVLHEQVHPVILEYPVRLGEATSCGSTILMIENLPLYERVSQLDKIPELRKFNTTEDLIANLNNLPSQTFEQRIDKTLKFKYTYINCISSLMQYLI